MFCLVWLLAAGAAAAPRVRVAVKVRGPVTAAVRARLAKAGSVNAVLDRLRLVDMELPEDAIARLETLPMVEYVERDRPIHLDAELPPDLSAGAGIWYLDLVNAMDVKKRNAAGPQFDAIRTVEETGEGVYVALIDSGLIADWYDPVTGRTWSWWDVFPRERIDLERSRSFVQGFEPDHRDWEQPSGFFHGTWVAGIILGLHAAHPQLPPPFPLDLNGVAPRVKLIMLRATPSDGEGSVLGAIHALHHAADLARELWPARLVVNNSWGTLDRSDLRSLVAAIDDAIDHGAIVVASGGNCGPYRGSSWCNGFRGMGYPGAFPRVISATAAGWTKNWTIDGVASLDPGWNAEDVPESGAAEVFLSSLSSRENLDVLDPQGNHQELDLVAPGSSMPVAPLLEFWTGSSFASPMVAGAAALLLEKDPTLTQEDIEDILTATAIPIPPGAAYLDRFVDEATGTTLIGENATPWTSADGAAGLLQVDAALRALPRPTTRGSSGD